MVRRSFNERWIDCFPIGGKRSGAYSNGGAYDVHPYMLLNYLGQHNDVSTLAHELGHTMHSYYSNKTQPYALANYPTFVAEVASTFNEALLIDRVLRDTIKDATTRLSLLGSYPREHQGAPSSARRSSPSSSCGCIEMAEQRRADYRRGAQPRSISTSRADTTATTDGICIVDDYVAHEWSYIPHFYADFYVFQYATSFTAAEALSEKVLAGDEAARKRYLTFLGVGNVEIPDRAAEGRRRRHDHRRAARPHDAEDEPRDGRNRRNVGKADLNPPLRRSTWAGL